MLPSYPMICRLVSILFFLSLLFVGVVGSAALWHSRMATQLYKSSLDKTAALQKKIEETRSSRSELEQNIREAGALNDWVLGSMPLQPLVVEIIRGMAAAENTTIVELGLERDPEAASQLRLSLNLKSDSYKQIESTLTTIREKLNYRERSPSQLIGRGSVEYRASLVRVAPEGPPPSPVDRAEEIVQP